jgi:hypothetical protein
MRLLLACVSLLITAALVRAADIEFLRVWPGWRDAESFERIGEYFGKPENTGRQTVLRTQAAERGGFYFLVRVKTAAAFNGRYELSIIRPDAPDPKVFTFPAAIPAKESVFQLGLTGADWPGGKDIHPVAWRLALIAGDGRVIAQQKSYLWEKPAK